MAKAVKAAAKKAAPLKKASKKALFEKKVTTDKSETGIKYADKSGDQPELVPVFDEIKKMLLPYGRGSIKVRGGSGGQITLVSEKPVEIRGKKRDEYWFAAALIQRGYVGFYFMPVHEISEKKEIFKPELLKCLKGKSCFHIKKMDVVIFKQMEEALAKGYNKCKEKGWL
ncbi:MAG: hypothetical protein ABIR15_04930 [Chitinophagaceae bacterium]